MGNWPQQVIHNTKIVGFTKYSTKNEAINPDIATTHARLTH